MEFLDEKIIEFRNNVRKEKFFKLETGMYVKDELVIFERIKLFNRMSIMLPQNFVDVDGKRKLVKKC